MSAGELPNDLPKTEPSVADLMYGEEGQIVVLPDEIDEQISFQLSKSRDRGTNKLEHSTPYQGVNTTPGTNDSATKDRKVVMEMQPL